MDSLERYHGLDAARAVALLLGITLHAACSFVPGFRAWVILDSQAGLAPAALVFVIHAFRMPLFFLMAGFFARLVCSRRGTGHFVRDRLRRIALPLVAGWFLLYPLFAILWIWSARLQNSPSLPPQIRNIPLWMIGPGALVEVLRGRQPVSLAHLWFLYYLLLLYASAFLLRSRLGSAGRLGDSVARGLFGRWWGVPGAAALLGGVLMAAGYASGMPNPEGLRPLIPTYAIYGMFFLAGWLLHRQPDLLGVVAGRWHWYSLGFVTCVTASMASLEVVAARPLYFYLYALSMWCGVIGFTGGCLRWLSAPGTFWRYLSDASYWMYLVHLPAICWLQVVIARWPMHWVWKLVLIHAVVLPPLVISYHFLVRPTFIGAVLNGKKNGRPPSTVPEAGRLRSGD